MSAEVPSYDTLVAQADPPGSAWAFFGAGDQLGTLNFATPERAAAAARLVRHGRVFNLDHPVNAFDPFPSGAREPARHHIFANNPNHRDDYVDALYLQSSSQIDGLRHIRSPAYGFYGGTPDDRIAVGGPDLGIQHWAESGIVTSGVLLDVERHLAAEGRPVDPASSRAITTADLDATCARQGTTIEPGDAVLVRTGWARHFLTELDADARRDLAKAMKCPGLHQAEETVRWLWDHRLSLAAADNIALEAMPPHPDSPFRNAGGEGPQVRGVSNDGMLHRVLIPLLGFVIGELWNLEALAADCARDGVYRFMLTAKPLNLVGAVGSPANALAIK